jgi:hypothetical protein
MGIILVPIAAISLLFWIFFLAKFLKNLRQAPDKSRFIKITSFSAIAATFFAMLVIAGIYGFSTEAYTFSVFFTGLCGLPVWLLLIGYFLLRKFSNDQFDALSLCSIGVLVAIPIFTIAFISNMHTIMKILGVTLTM